MFLEQQISIFRADRPYTQNTQVAYVPETPWGPLALKDVLILVSFLIISFNPVHCHALYVKISQIM